MGDFERIDRLLTRPRARFVAMMMLAMTIVGIVTLFLTAHGTVDAMGRPIGTDFSNVWTAGHMANDGRAAEAWDWPTQYKVQQAVHRDTKIPFYGWHYPPPFLIIASLLALFPYITALVIWQGLTLALCLTVVKRILPEERDAWLLALGAPVVLICMGHGQNAFMTASLLGGGMLLLDRRPWLAGVLLGALVYKPQFAVLIPVIIVARGNWRAFLSAGMTAAGLCLLTFAVWGWPVWQAFFDSLQLTQHVVIEAGQTGWEKIPSAFASVRQWGGSIALAYGIQSAVALIAILIAGAVAWRGSMEARGAATLSAALLSTPYVLDYDHVLLGVAIAFMAADMAKRGPLRWEPSWLALAWIAPLFGRWVGEATYIPLNLIAAVAILGLAARRAILLDALRAPTLERWIPRRIA